VQPAWVGECRKHMVSGEGWDESRSGLNLGTHRGLAGEECLVLSIIWTPVDQDVGRNL
jgi:hypothetical protein